MDDWKTLVSFWGPAYVQGRELLVLGRLYQGGKPTHWRMNIVCIYIYISYLHLTLGGSGLFHQNGGCISFKKNSKSDDSDETNPEF